MKRRNFLHTAVLAGAAFGVHRVSHARTIDSSTSRFLEVVRTTYSQWYDKRRLEVARMAMEAAGAGRSDAYVRPLDSLTLERLASLVENAGNGETDIKRFIARLDPWCSYLSPRQWRQYNESLHPDYSGVGMDLEQEKDGSFTCWPYPGSSAEMAGVRPGAKLVSVDDHPVSGLSIYAIGAMVRGRRGTPVSLSVSRFIGLSNRLEIMRSPAQSRTVFRSEAREGVQVLRISRFSSSTPAELSQRISPGTPIVELDLSGCRGGELDAAVEAASLFLPTGELVCRIDRVRDRESLRTSGGRKLRNTQVVLHQDGNTASAAEVFIAALVEHGAATSYGSTTLGKATTQDVMPLENGGALVLTTGLISGPNGHTWHSAGIPPRR